MTDTIEAVARAVCAAHWADQYGQTADADTVDNEWFDWQPEAQAAITTLDRHRIKRAGDVEQRLLALKWMVHDEMRGLITDTTAHEAAAIIAAQKAKIERLTEREAQAKLDGVRAGIEASALLLERDDGFGEWWDAAQFVRSELDAEAITKGEG